MYHITIRPDTYKIISEHKKQDVDARAAEHQHNEITKSLKLCVIYGLNKKGNIPEIVCTSSMGLSLPRLPEQFVVLPWMKYPHRRNELNYIEDIFKDRSIKTVKFPGSHVAPFEGMSEAKWFDGGQLLVVGYGYRATKESVKILRQLLKEIYEGYGVEPPRVVSFQLQTPVFFHLDIAMLEFGPTECIINKAAFSAADINRLRSEMGERNVYVVETEDILCLNSIIEGDSLLSHTLSDNSMKAKLEKITGKAVVELDISEFEKSGASVRSLVFDVYDHRMIKRKSSSHALCSSPK